MENALEEINDDRTYSIIRKDFIIVFLSELIMIITNIYITNIYISLECTPSTN